MDFLLPPGAVQPRISYFQLLTQAKQRLASANAGLRLLEGINYQGIHTERNRLHRERDRQLDRIDEIRRKIRGHQPLPAAEGAGRGRGGAGGTGTPAYSLSDSDIKRALGLRRVWLYSDLSGLSNLNQMFDSKGRAVLLYETEGPTTGHWCALIRKGGDLEYFDPYGGIAPDGERKWLSAAKAAQLGEDRGTLSSLIRASGLNLTYNHNHYQSKAAGDNECGRHVIARLYNYRDSEDEYAARIRASGLSPDQYALQLSLKLDGGK